MPDKMWMLFFSETTFTNDRQKSRSRLLQNRIKIQKILWMEESLDFILQVILPMQMVQLL